MKHIISLVLVLICSMPVYACDVCGTSTGNQGLGLLPQMYQHFVGIQYQHKTYSSVHPALSDRRPDTHSDEHYRTVQAWGRFCIGKKWQAFAFVPYRSNTFSSNNTHATVQGIGDISVLVNYTLLQSNDSTTTPFKHRLQGGAGLKMPTAKYTGVTERELSGLPNIQAGTGAWDIPLNANYTLRYSNIGLNVDVMYNITTANKDNYKYGERFTSQLSFFYWAQAGKVAILPQLSLRNEYALHDYDNYGRKWLNDQTGGYILSAQAGVQIYFKSIGWQVQYAIPFQQQYGGGNVTAKSSFDTGLMFLF